MSATPTPTEVLQYFVAGIALGCVLSFALAFFGLGLMRVLLRIMGEEVVRGGKDAND